MYLFHSNLFTAPFRTSVNGYELRTARAQPVAVRRLLGCLPRPGSRLRGWEQSAIACMSCD